MSDLIERQAVLDALAYAGFRQGLAAEVVRRVPSATFTGTQPNIDWSHVHPDYNWLAQDKDGKAYLYQQRPRGPYAQVWHFSPFCMKTTTFASYTPGTCDWRDSLVMRPGHVEAVQG